ncbi:MAG: response regulator transcription factor [Spirochaetaceae bacterium]|jgi:DNA-binding NarL/FixJ family response regulator|uniref:DNA-binding response regulator n=1 Tax=Sphaerochaeta halotolerans TaxID=2293840 RepID=A0A372MJG8_9SPIR|nr:response regulator transcription factor [Sphaerochaeta halotolerans]MBG0767157.1 response regulator transcription factor [Spirochaetaceae bacterium]RFU95884.1 DNA-binding response regulator [Sphaerochaeta halotolerans]
MSNIVRFLIVDDHPLFRQGLVSVIENVRTYQVQAQATTIAEALSLLDKTEVDVALIDISLQQENGLELVKTLKTSKPEVQSIVVSMYDELIYASSALKAGARGYVMKQEAASSLLKAIDTVLKGKIYLSDDMRERILDTMLLQESAQEIDPVELLSLREMEVLRLLGQGYGVSEIGKTLNLSVKTINVYRDNIRHKLSISDAGALRKFAIKWVKSNEM